jgi:polyisoprenoid-binding protein YceI
MGLQRFFTTFAVLLATVPAFGAATKYSIDKDHSKIGFTVRHMMISDVEGNFKDFEGSFTLDADKDLVTDGKFVAQTASISTDNVKRDEHLQSADFFDAKKFPQITFNDTKLKKTSKDHYKWSGNLTMHGETHPMTFDLEHKGTIKDPYGNMRAGFEANGTLKRSEWGLKWNKALEAGGGVVVSDDVRVHLAVEAIQAKDGAASVPQKPAKK